MIKVICLENNSKKKILARVIALSVFFLANSLPLVALAGPEGGVVVGGEGSIRTSANTTTIYQSSRRLAVDWKSFNVGKGERVRFVQPGTNSIALNRILSDSPSQIFGAIEANGRIVLANPSGILFSSTSTVNVNALIASGLSINARNFMNGDLVFQAIDGKHGYVINHGIIKAASSVSLIGSSVANEGASAFIEAQLVAIDAASGAVLTFDPQGLIGVKVNKEVTKNYLNVNAAAVNSGTISAGKVLIQANVAASLFDSAVNNSGIINATGIDVSGGVVRLSGNGHVSNSGKIDATSATSVGGEIAILGDSVQIASASIIDASGQRGGGKVLIGREDQGQGNTQALQITAVEQGASIKVDALSDGSGGTVMVWADGSTVLDGNTSARGGSNSGDGGSVEISGKENVQISGHPDLRAPMGKAGSLSIDSRAVIIRRDTGAGNDQNIFNDRWINEQLVNSDLFITTSSASGINGAALDIIFDVNTSIDWSAPTTLSFSAGRNIIFDSSVTIIQRDPGEGGVEFSFGKNASSASFTLNGANISTANALVAVVGSSTSDTFIGGKDFVLLGDNRGTADSISFEGIEHLTGTSGNDSFDFNRGKITGSINGLAGSDTLIGSNNYSLTSLNAGAATKVAGGFSGIEHLIGTSGNDRFNVGGGSLSGSINGGLGDDVIVGDSRYSLTGLNAGTASKLGGGFRNIENLTGTGAADSFTIVGGWLDGAIDGGSGSDTLIGGRNYKITAANYGEVTNADTVLNPIFFTRIENLTGTIADDTFVFSARGQLTGNIDGGAGIDDMDTVNYAKATVIQNAQLAKINNIEKIIGGGDGFTLAGGKAFILGGVHGDGNNDGVVNTATKNGIIFIDWGNLVGTAGNDSFTIINGGKLTGTIDGLGGNDTLQSSAGTFIIRGANAGTAGANRFFNVENLTGTEINNIFNFSAGSVEGVINGAGGNNTISGLSQYQITGANEGAVVGTGGFTSITDLVGTSGSDSFIFGENGSLSGTVDGAGGASDTIDFAALGTFVLDLSDTRGTQGKAAKYANVETFIGAGTGFTITGGEQYVVTGINDGSVDGTNFIDWATLVGSNGDDLFILAGGSVTGVIDGAGGNDSLFGGVVANMFAFDGNSSVTVDGIEIVNVSNFHGGDGADVFVFTGAVSVGNITGGGGDDTFKIGGAVNIELSGGAGNDSFIFDGGAVITAVDGGADLDLIVFNGSESRWDFTGSKLMLNGISFNNIERFQDNAELSADVVFSGAVNMRPAKQVAFGESIFSYGESQTLSIRAGSIDLTDFEGGGDVSLVATNGAIGGLGNLKANGNIVLSATGDIALASLQGRDVDITSTSGNVTLGKTSIDVLSVSSREGDISFQEQNELSIVSIVGRSLDFTAGGSVRIGGIHVSNNLFGTVNNGSFETLNQSVGARANLSANTIRLSALAGTVGTPINPYYLDTANVATLIARLVAVDLAPRTPLPLIQGSRVSTISEVALSSSLSSVVQAFIESLGEVDPAVFTALTPYDTNEEPLLMPDSQEEDKDELARR